MREVVVAMFWIGPLSLLLYLSDTKVRYFVSEIPYYLRRLAEMFFS